MPSEVQPLRINKSSAPSSPAKMSHMTSPRALQEIAPGERRRNSPSFNQTTKNMISTRDSSPFEASPRGFWQTRESVSPSRYTSENSFESEQQTLSPKRSSIENLKKASRVKNSSMFAREHKNEYDPTSAPVSVERPLANGRPYSMQWQELQGNAFGGRGIEGMRSNSPNKGHRRGESMNNIPIMSSPHTSPSKARDSLMTANSPAKERFSPNKSSLRYSNPVGIREDEVLSEEDGTPKYDPARPLRRHAKSVTFEKDPPVINEYEQVTPEPSSIASGSREGSYDSAVEEDEEESFEQGSMQEDSFDASLEDTDKTPVVLPEDWQNMSPENAKTSLANTFEDPFDGPEASPIPISKQMRSTAMRSESLNSDGEVRPLPPLPGRSRRDSSIGLATAAERASQVQRSLPSPPPAAAVSKSEILGMRNPSLSLEDRLRMMGLQDSQPQENQEQQEQSAPESVVEEDPLGIAETSAFDLDSIKIPRISRESILRKVKSRNFDEEEVEYEESNSVADFSYGDLDPDQPIPSREASSNFEDQIIESFIVKEEKVEEIVSVHTIPAAYSPERSPSRMEDYRDGSVVRHDISGNVDDDAESVYSTQQTAEEPQQVNSGSASEDDGPPTPKQEDFVPSPKASSEMKEDLTKHMSLAHFKNFLGDDGFKSGFGDYLTPDSETMKSANPFDSAPKLPKPIEEAQRPQTPEEQLLPPTVPSGEPGTPDSIVRHSVIEPSLRNSPGIPEPIATIKAPGGKLKTRSSLGGQDAAAMAATRRQISGEYAPPIPRKSSKRNSMSLEPELRPTSSESTSSEASQKEASQPGRRKSFKMKLDIPVTDDDGDLSFGLDKEFDRVIEAQKVAFSQLAIAQAQMIQHHPSHHRFPTPAHPYIHTNQPVLTQKGYLMRQNTKVVVASSRQFSDEMKPPMSPTAETPALAAAAPRGTRSAGNSPRKPSGETWKTEPWNGKVRRKSVRQNSGAARKPIAGPVPPMPGMESVVAQAETPAESNIMSSIDEDEDNVDRGRVFVKVVGVKDLDLPLPKNERTWFQLTLDNGLHCVTTSWLELGRAAPIGQEFELVVLNDLEFQLTLQTKLQAPPKPAAAAPSSPTKSVSPKKSTSAFSRLLSSPKKRREAELQKQAEALAAQQAQDAAAKRNSQSSQHTAWDLLHTLVGADGSFARAYVSLNTHESQCFGRPFTVDVPCFNEWAQDERMDASVKSKRGGVVRRPPYRIGKLTLQLLYVPKPKDAKDEDLPKSMNAAIREMHAKEEEQKRKFEGYLSQQGGDCPFWRRRFFRLSGAKLTAYHESTLQPRCTLNLAKAVKLIDDKSTLTQPNTSSPSKNGKSSGRRKSAFNEEDGAYMFVEEGFRIRFANGECIDFYADSAREKEGWMKVLSEAVGSDAAASAAGGKAAPWTDLVLEHEKTHGRAGDPPPPASTSAPATSSVPTPSSRPQPRPQSATLPSSSPIKSSPTDTIAPTSQIDKVRALRENANPAGPRKDIPARDGSKSAATSPVKGGHRRPEVPLKDEMPPLGGSSPRKRGDEKARMRRENVRSMIF